MSAQSGRPTDETGAGPGRIRIVEVLAPAWVKQKKVRIRYQRLDSYEFVNHTIRPYLMPIRILPAR